MDRRNFIKSGLFAAAAGAAMGPKAIAQEANKRMEQEQKTRDILNYNPQMQYRPMGRTGVNVSALGFGMLRLPMKSGHVDFDQTTPMVHRAIEGGVNYIDTGRVYMGGESEQAVGKALAGGWRDRVYVTSKMPWWEMQRADDFEKFFDQSRRAIDTDVIDFYHIHMIMHRAWKDYVLPYRLIEKMENLKAQGKIRFMGFSFHDSLQLFKRVVEYTPAWVPWKMWRQTWAMQPRRNRICSHLPNARHWGQPSTLTVMHRDTLTAPDAISAFPARRMSPSATSSPMSTITICCTATRSGQ